MARQNVLVLSNLRRMRDHPSLCVYLWVPDNKEIPAVLEQKKTEIQQENQNLLTLFPDETPAVIEIDCNPEDQSQDNEGCSLPGEFFAAFID